MEKNIVIIILNWNGAAATTACVRSLQHSRFQNFDIIICDNGSAQDETERLRDVCDARTTLVRSERNRGFAGGNNFVVQKLLGARRYSYYLFLNQDTIVDERCLGELFALMESHERVAVCGPKVLERDGRLQSLGARYNPWNGKIISRFQGRKNDGGLPQQPERVPIVVGNCFMVRADAWNSVGSFDEQYFAYYEEADWCLRAHYHGWHCVVVPAAHIIHAKSTEFRTYLITRNMIWFQKRHATPPQKFIFFFIFWFLYIPERLKKGSSLRLLLRGARDGWQKKLLKEYP